MVLDSGVLLFYCSDFFLAGFYFGFKRFSQSLVIEDEGRLFFLTDHPDFLTLGDQKSIRLLFVFITVVLLLLHRLFFIFNFIFSNSPLATFIQKYCLFAINHPFS